ncbi:MAG TPA: phosphoribosylformylglycinamidine synthase subunit PurQ [Gemmataceae bacterium]|jgi:phosphoribosylformylglycinamidine synthase|nr:phosphoribosylformylglycinamidine synthase subunit PurQ [Gemmataceae bacterium]
MATPSVLILRAPGTNCDEEAQYAFQLAGAIADRVHINRLRENPALLHRYQILMVPGGFSYGDDVGAGKILANQLTAFLGEELRKFRDKEKLILGVCNGFQAILKAGLLMPPDDEGPMATLTFNTHGYQDRWLYVKVATDRSPFLKGINSMHIPMAHGEGNFVCRKEWILKGLPQSGQVALRYVNARGGPAAGYPENPNGSQDDIAGVCDFTGRVLGLMPHPERHVLPTQHPRWTREGLKKEGDGLQLFRNAVEYFA